MPNKRGSVGRNILKSSPGVNSYNGKESGVKKTMPRISLSKEKIATRIINSTNGTSEKRYCSVTIKKAFSAIKSAENPYTHNMLLRSGKAMPFFVYYQ